MNHDLVMHSCNIGANNHRGGVSTGAIYYVFTLLNLCFICQHVTMVLMRIIISFTYSCLIFLLHDLNILGFFPFILHSHTVVFGYLFRARRVKLIKIINLYNLDVFLCQELEKKCLWIKLMNYCVLKSAVLCG